MSVQEMADQLRGLFMRGGAVEGTPEHQQILAIMSESVRDALQSLLKPFEALWHTVIHLGACQDSWKLMCRDVSCGLLA